MCASHTLAAVGARCAGCLGGAHVLVLGGVLSGVLGGVPGASAAASSTTGAEACAAGAVADSDATRLALCLAALERALLQW